MNVANNVDLTEEELKDLHTWMSNGSNSNEFVRIQMDEQDEAGFTVVFRARFKGGVYYKTQWLYSVPFFKESKGELTYVEKVSPQQETTTVFRKVYN